LRRVISWIRTRLVATSLVLIQLMTRLNRAQLAASHGGVFA